MTIDSPILGLIALLPAFYVFRSATRLRPAGRWTMRAAAVFAVIAVAGVGVRWPRPVKIVVAIDVSPSTRGAAFRDERAVRTRLTPLLAGRPYSIEYFADGGVTGPGEVMSDRTRLDAPADADAVVLLSDGRVATDGMLPPTFVPVDPTLDRPADARVSSIAATTDGTGVLIDAVGQPGRTLTVTARGPVASLALSPGPQRLSAPVTADTATVNAVITAGDAWPENDTLAFTRATLPTRRISVDVPLAGYITHSAGSLPTQPAGLADVASVAISTRTGLTSTQRATLQAYVRDLGGTVVLVGPPGGAMAAASPLSAFAPAGVGRWIVLLDASGSMAAAAGDRTRWQSAVDAATNAVDRLPTHARVSVLAFSNDVRTLAEVASVDAAKQALAAARSQPPGGPTGLRAALESLGRSSLSGPTRVLLLTDGDADLGDTATLVDALTRANLRVDAMVAEPSTTLARVCDATGGRVVTAAAVETWATQFGGLADTPTSGIAGPIRAVGRQAWAGRSLGLSQGWPAWVKADAEALLDVDGRPFAAAWPSGLGRIIAIAGMPGDGDWSTALRSTERAVTDTRLSVAWDDAGGVVRVTARDDAGRPVNDLRPTLRRDGSETSFDLVSPGVYQAKLARLTRATAAAIVERDRVVSRRAIAGRYAEEFDAIGNNWPSLQAIADTTGGRVIAAGDDRPIDFPARYHAMSLQPVATVLAAGCFVAATLFLRRERTGVPGQRGPRP